MNHGAEISPADQRAEPTRYPLDKASRNDLYVIIAMAEIGAIAILAALTLSCRADVHSAAKLTIDLEVLPPIVALYLFGLAFAVLYLRRAGLTLYPDRVEFTGAFGSKSMSKADIAGIRRFGQDRVRLRSKRDGRVMTVYKFGAGAAFDDWFRDLPDLDKVDQAKLEADPAWGADAQERNARLKRLGWIGNSFGVAAWAVGAWAWFHPAPFALVALANLLIPIAALGAVAWSNGQIAILAFNNRPQIVLALLPSGLTLFLLEAGWPIADPAPVWIAALALGVLAAPVGWFSPDATMPGRLGAMALIFGVTVAYVGGATLTLNQLLDRSRPHHYLGVVHDRSVSGRGGTLHMLDVQPYGHPEAGTLSFDVSRTTYERYPVGQLICVAGHRGALNLRWFNLENCARAPGIAPVAQPTATPAGRS